MPGFPAFPDDLDFDELADEVEEAAKQAASRKPAPPRR